MATIPPGYAQARRRTGACAIQAPVFIIARFAPPAAKLKVGMSQGKVRLTYWKAYLTLAVDYRFRLRVVEAHWVCVRKGRVMRTAFLIGTIAALVVGCSSEPGGSGSDRNGGDDDSKTVEVKARGAPKQNAFAQQYIGAVNADDRGAIKQLTHPTCLKGVNDRNRTFYTQFFDNCVDDAIPEHHDVTFEKLGKDDPLPGEKMLQYPVRPTHRFGLTYSDSEHSDTTVSRSVMERDGRWYLIIPAPGEDLLERMSKDQ